LKESALQQKLAALGRVTKCHRLIYFRNEAALIAFEVLARVLINELHIAQRWDGVQSKYDIDAIREIKGALYRGNCRTIRGGKGVAFNHIKEVWCGIGDCDGK